MNCKKCGYTLSSMDVICPNCGEVVSAPVPFEQTYPKDVKTEEVATQVGGGNVVVNPSNVIPQNSVISPGQVANTYPNQDVVSLAGQIPNTSEGLTAPMANTNIAINPTVIGANINETVNQKKKLDIKFIMIVSILVLCIIILTIFIFMIL